MPQKPDFSLELFRFRSAVEIRWSDLDAFQHVNNAVYLTYFEQGRIKYFREMAIPWNWRETGAILAHAEVNYWAPLHFNDNAWIYVRCCRLGQKSMDFEYLIAVEKTNGALEIATTGKTSLVAYSYEKSLSVKIPPEARKEIELAEGL